MALLLCEPSLRGYSWPLVCLGCFFFLLPGSRIRLNPSTATATANARVAALLMHMATKAPVLRPDPDGPAGTSDWESVAPAKEGH